MSSDSFIENKYSMNFKELVFSRRSIRAFIKKPIPRDILEEVASIAARAPSNCNTQPWKVYIVSGEPLKQLGRDLIEAVDAGKVNPDVEYNGIYSDVYQERQYEAARQLYKSMSIPREDKKARKKAFMRNFIFFDAPHVAFFYLPSGFGMREAADLGMCAQTFMLALSSFGLGSCPQTALSMNADLVRAAVGSENDDMLMFGISFGWEDSSNNVNNVRTDRADLSDSFRFVG